MFDFPLIISTLFVLFLAIISPGPDFIIVLRNSLTFGRKAGFFSALGVATGCLISFTLVVCGLKILFAYKVIRGGLSLICGAYLIYMGVMSLRAKPSQQHLDCKHRHSTKMSTYYRNGLFTNIFNPKLYTLAVAILTFPEQMKPNLATNTAIVIGQSIMALIWFSLVSFVMSHGKVQDVYFRRERLINILLGFVFIILGSKIMFG